MPRSSTKSLGFWLRRRGLGQNRTVSRPRSFPSRATIRTFELCEERSLLAALCCPFDVAGSADEGSAARIEVAGTLPVGDTIWSADQGDYLVTGDLLVPPNARLIIQPGTQVHVTQGRELRVNGTLIANGTEQSRIRFTAPPDAADVPDTPHGAAGLPAGPPRWLGIHLRDSRGSENQLSYVDIEYAQSDDGSVGVINSDADLSHLSFKGTHLRMLFAHNASLSIRDSSFPNMFADDEHPVALGLDNVSEHIKITGRPPSSGRLEIRGNNFGTNRGHNDVIDADSGRRPGPILQILDNVFAGVGDEMLDLGGDVLIAGNLFQHNAKDPDNRDARFANAISTGDAGTAATIVVTQNVFFDVDHTLHLRVDTTAIFEHNTVVQVHPAGAGLGAAIALFANVAGETPGYGALVRGNVFWEVPTVFGNADRPAEYVSQLRFEGNLVSTLLAETSIADRPGTLVDLGAGNVVAIPQFVDPLQGNFQLAEDSPGRNLGPLEHDPGAYVPAGVWIAGAPHGPTEQRELAVQIGGPGIFAYRFRVNAEVWSEPVPIDPDVGARLPQRTATLTLSSLTPGDYQLEVIGQDFAGNWQTTSPATVRWAVVDRRGDLNFDQQLDGLDIGLLCAAVRDSAAGPAHDLNGDDLVSPLDVDYLVESILQSTPGDANLDRRFDSTDLVLVFQQGEYEDDTALNSTWAEGDWNCDGEFTSSDLVAAFQQGSYLAEARAMSVRGPR